MTRINILMLVVFWGMLTLAEPALASCTNQTVIMPDGRVLFCETCCSGVNCTTTCF